MSEQNCAKHLSTIALALVLVAIPIAGFSSVCVLQPFPSLLSLSTVNIQQPGLNVASGQSVMMAGSPLSNVQRWYVSFLTQQQVITCQVDELRERLRENLIGPEEFLERLDVLLQKADRLYAQWKRVSLKNGLRDSPGETKTGGPGKDVPIPAAEAATPASESSAASTQRNDVAVGKCLNYLRLSIVNFFLGYADSNGRQIDDAERQVSLSGVWRSRSLSFIKALEPAPDRPAS